MRARQGQGHSDDGEVVELRQLRCFVTVAEELHFGRAAARLHIVQPTVSQQVQRLERELEVKLFDRSPRRVLLTAAGERFLPAARAVLAAEQEARAVAARFRGPERTFRLGTVGGMGDRLDRIVGAFAQRAPQVRVELVALPVRERLAQVAEGTLDAAFLRSPRGTVAGLRYLPGWDDELVAAVPAAHPVAARARVALPDLAGLQLRLPERQVNPALVDLVLGRCRQDGLQPVQGPASATLQDTLAGIGSGGIPAWTVVYAANAERLLSRRVAFRPFGPPPLVLPMAIAVREAAAESAPIRLLLSAVGADEQAAACSD